VTVAESSRWRCSWQSEWRRAASGERRILGLELAAGNDDGNAWAPFLHGLLERGLAGVRPVISDAHPGLVPAVRSLLLGAAWQRCRVHATRNATQILPDIPWCDPASLWAHPPGSFDETTVAAAIERATRPNAEGRAGRAVFFFRDLDSI
jgi:putative transposase